MLETKFQKPGLTPGLTLGDDAVIRGYASVFGLRDQGGDVVAPGAYAASLAGGRKVRMLWQHDQAQPIGVWDEIAEDAHGLRVKGRLLTDVARAREAVALMNAGAVDGLSIGYRTVRAEKMAGGGRKLIELDLYEISLVTFPMLPEARIAAKSGDTQASVLMAEMAQALTAARDALRGIDPPGR